MRIGHRRSGMYGTIAALTLLCGAAGLQSAAAAAVPVGPHQFFAGEVNGARTGVVIRVACVGPVVEGQTGHPVAGQTVDVVPAAASTSAAVGYTGESADHVLVGFGTLSSTVPLSLSSYGVKAAIPTNIELPCYGPGQVTFVPAPDSATAHAATVAVTYQGIGV